MGDTNRPGIHVIEVGMLPEQVNTNCSDFIQTFKSTSYSSETVTNRSLK